MQNVIPFGLGSTFYGPTQSIDVSSTYANVKGVGYEGLECEFVDVDPSDLTRQRAGSTIKTRIVRNVSGVTLQGKYFGSYAGGTKLKRIAGYHRVDNDIVAGVIDPYLPSNGVRDGDLCHVVEEGYCIHKTPKAGADFGTVAWTVGQDLCAVTDTAANGTTTTSANIAGRMQGITTGTWTATQTTDGTMANYVRNVAAEVMSAMTSGQTSTDCLIRMKLPR